MITKRFAVSAAAGVVAASAFVFRASGSEPGNLLTPAAAVADHPASHAETAIFSDGCFWGVQGLFQHVRGVTGTTAGYDGGAAGTASYEQVSTGDTGHAESVRVTFDPTVTSYAELLRIYFSVAGNPTEVNGQTPDLGTQYRSMLWVRNDDQRRVATAYIRQLDATHVFPQPVATRVEADHGFYPAEDYHQNFLATHPDHPYITTWDKPKLDALHRLFPADWRDDAVLAPAPGARAGS